MTEDASSHELIVSGADIPAPSGSIEVLYADAHAAIRETTRSAMTAHREDISVSGVGTVEAAIDVAATTPPSCLVIDPVGLDDVETPLASVDAPMILYSDRAAAKLDSDLTSVAATIVEKGPTNRGAFLAEKVIGAADSPADRSEYALQQALTDVTRRAETEQAVFLVGDAGEITWSSHSLDSLVGVTLEAAGNLYDGLAELCANTPDETTVEQFRERPTGAVTVRTALASTDQHLLLQGYPLADGADDRTLVIVRDITTTAGRAARLSLLELLTERAQDGLYTLDERGIIDFCNESFATNLGYDPEELRGEHAEVTLAPGELEKGQRTISELLSADEDSTTVDLTFRRKDGTEREMSIHYTLLRDEKGGYSGLMGVVRDITARKEREREIATQRDELATLAQVHVLIQDVIRALGSVATRADIKETVCEALVESDLYQFAWIGERGRVQYAADTPDGGRRRRELSGRRRRPGRVPGREPGDDGNPDRRGAGGRRHRDRRPRGRLAGGGAFPRVPVGGRRAAAPRRGRPRGARRLREPARGVQRAGHRGLYRPGRDDRLRLHRRPEPPAAGPRQGRRDGVPVVVDGRVAPRGGGGV